MWLNKPLKILHLAWNCSKYLFSISANRLGILCEEHTPSRAGDAAHLPPLLLGLAGGGQYLREPGRDPRPQSRSRPGCEAEGPELSPGTRPGISAWK